MGLIVFIILFRQHEPQPTKAQPIFLPILYSFVKIHLSTPLYNPIAPFGQLVIGLVATSGGKQIGVTSVFTGGFILTIVLILDVTICSCSLPKSIPEQSL